MIVLLLAAQAATAPPAPAAASPAPASPSFSILQPVPDQPCVRRPQDDTHPDDIVVCGQPLASQALPLREPAERRGGNPDRTGTGALAAESTPCAARIGGCQTGVDFFGMGTAAVRLVQKVVAPGSCCEEPGEGTNVAILGKDVVSGIGHAFRKKPDKAARVAIPLDDAPPPKGVILP